MSRYPLKLPVELKQEAEQLAAQQGVSLNQFVLWAVAEKVATVRSALNDPRFPHILYRQGAAGTPQPVLARSNIRVETLVLAIQKWGFSPEQAAQEFGLTLAEAQEALAFYQAHQKEIDLAIQTEQVQETTLSHE